MSKSKLSNTNRRKQINYCKTCNKIRVIDNEYCDACKLKQYLSGIEEIKAIQSLSSYSILFDNNKVIPNEFKQLEELHKRIAMTTSIASSNKSNENRFLNMKHFNKYHGTFTKIQRKMRNIQKFYPEIYYDKRDVISMWSSYQLRDTLDLNKLECYDDNFLWF